jgi:hypothetical protein
MIGTQRIIERGWWTSMSAPETAPADRTARIGQLDTVLTALAPVFRPLALEVELGWRELDTGLPSPSSLDAPLHLLVLEGAQRGVTLRPTVVQPPPPRPVAALDGAAVAACLSDGEPPEPGLLLDWVEVRSVAAAVRAAESVQELRFEELGRAITPYEPHWFAGPVGEHGYEVWPPGLLRVTAQDRVRFTLVVYWSRWLQPGTGERARVEAAIRRLQSLGWEKEEKA